MRFHHPEMRIPSIVIGLVFALLGACNAMHPAAAKAPSDALGGPDQDKDGIPDSLDDDDNGDGVPDVAIQPDDCDGDGVPEAENEDCDGWCVTVEGGFIACDDGVPPTGAPGDGNPGDDPSQQAP